MIRITIEMVPGGNDDHAYLMAQGVIINDGKGTAGRGNYDYGLTRQTNIPGRDPGISREGKVVGFDRRSRNVWHLVKMVLDDAF